jgi:hypothetical protein
VLLTASYDEAAQVWNADSGERIRRLEGHDDAVTNARMSPDGTRIVTASHDLSARLWETETGRQIAVLEGHDGPVDTVEFSQDGKLLLTAAHGVFQVWGASDGRRLAEWTELRGLEQTGIRVALSPEGKRVLLTHEKAASIWDWEKKAAVVSLQSPPSSFEFVAFSPDGRRAITTTGFWSHDARLWDVETGKELARWNHAFDIAAFSSDGRRVAAGGVHLKDVRVMSTADGAEVAVLRGHEVGIHSVAFSSDGLRILTSGQDRTARVWDAATGKILITLRGHSGEVLDAAFSPDGRKVATGSKDGTARIWTLDALSAAEARKPRELTLEEIELHGLAPASEVARVRDLISRPSSPPEAVETLRQAAMPEPLRRAALQEVRHLLDPDAALAWAWQVVPFPEFSGPMIDRALALAHWANAQGPTLRGAVVEGVALLRKEKPADAIALLTQARERAAAKDEVPLELLGAIAVCQKMLGRQAEAAATIAPILRLSEDQHWYFLDQTIAFVHGQVASRATSR